MSEPIKLDMDTALAQLTEKFGEKIPELIGLAIEGKIKELNLDKVDRKHNMFPGVEGGDSPILTPSQRVDKFLRAVVMHSQDPQDVAMVKALSEGTTTAGGYLVADEVRAELIKRATDASELFPYVKVIPVSTDAGNMPKLATDIEISWDEAENADADETDPVFSQLTWTIHRMNAINKMSQELLEDSNPGMVGVITDLFAEAVARERDKMIAIGSGSSQPKGIYSETGVDSVAVSGSITYAKLLETQYTLKRKYHPKARWCMNSVNLRRILALVDDNGQPIIQQGALAGGAIPTILGKPYSINDNFPDSAICYGDLSRYYWFDRKRMSIASTDVGGEAFQKNQVWIKVIERCDGQLSLNGSGDLGAIVRATNITA